MNAIKQDIAAISVAFGSALLASVILIQASSNTLMAMT